MKTYFTSESVTCGHPDKVCDQIADAVLDDILANDPDAHVACEVTACTGEVHLMGEITSSYVPDYEAIARKVIAEIGYTVPVVGFDAENVRIRVSIHTQSPDIARGVDRGAPEEAGAGDQGMMFGYACCETGALMPLPITLANRLTRKLEQVRREKLLPYLLPDGKAQVSVEYEDGKPKRISAVVVSAQHSAEVGIDALRDAVENPAPSCGPVCAVMLECVQGEGGVRPASQEFLQGLRDLCDEKGILLMFDEVQVGSGRTGKLFAHQNYGVEPDTCSMAKALGSGVPIGAVCARGEAAKTLTPGTHGSTFAGGPLACALAATTLDVMINDGVIENSRKMGEYFRKQAHEIIEKNHPETVNEIRGLGLIDGIQLNKPSGQPVVDLCFKDSNVLINNTNGNVLRFVPPLIVNEEEIDIVIKAVDEAMTKLGW